MRRVDSRDDFLFTAAVTIASRALILRDALLRRLRQTSLDRRPGVRIARQTIESGSRRLDAVFVAPASRPARAAVLLCHGIGETVRHWLAVQALLADRGVASLVFDYAGFGTSTGRTRWKRCEEDAVDAFHALQALVPDTPVSLLGFSLGSGVAAAILDRVSPNRLILCSAFTSFRAAARCAGLPKALSSLVPPIWNTEESLGSCRVPLLVLHCEKDRLFPVRMAAALAAQCIQPAELVVVANHRHNDPFYRPSRRYWDHVVSFLVSDNPSQSPGVKSL